MLFYYFMPYVLHLLYPVLYKTGRTVNKTYCLVPDWQSWRQCRYWQGLCMSEWSPVQVIGGLRYNGNSHICTHTHMYIWA